jgi:hypothetical protein
MQVVQLERKAEEADELRQTDAVALQFQPLLIALVRLRLY